MFGYHGERGDFRFGGLFSTFALAERCIAEQFDLITPVEWEVVNDGTLHIGKAMAQIFSETPMCFKVLKTEVDAWVKEPAALDATEGAG